MSEPAPGRVSSYFLRRMPERAAGKVHSVFRASFNVEAGGLLAHVGGAGTPLSCLGMNISPWRMRELLPGIRQGDRAVLRDGSLRVYGVDRTVTIPYGDFEIVPLELPRCQPPPGPSLLKALEAMELEQRVGIPIDSRLARALTILRAPGAGPCLLREAVGFLLGRGKGLTPSGDDILMGYGAGLLAWGDAGPFCRVLRQRLDRQTTDVSAAYLEAMMEGCVNEDYWQLFQVAAAGEEDLYGGLLAVISRHGHTSGWDSLLGLRTAAEASMRKKEELSCPSW